MHPSVYSSPPPLPLPLLLSLPLPHAPTSTLVLHVAGLVGTREPLSEEELHEMIGLRSNFEYVCTLCPVIVPTPIPTNPWTRLPLPPTPAPGKLDPSDACLGGTCTFRLYFGAPCDYPDKECPYSRGLRVPKP